MSYDPSYTEYIKSLSEYQFVEYSIVPFSSLLLYFFGIFFLEKLIIDRTRPPVKYISDGIMVAHNIILVIMSTYMFIEFCDVVLRTYITDGLFGLVCGSSVIENNVQMINVGGLYFLSKVYELFDTFLVILRGKPASFLQIYHHVNILFLCWLAVRYSHFMGWVVALNNTFVHILMYTYYSLVSAGYTPGWKKLLTILQISQFIVDGIVSMPYVWYYFFSDECTFGNIYIYIYGNIFGIGLVGLFLNFFKAAYTNGPAVKIE